MKINVAQDFSDVPAGRYRTHGPFSGERFREELLAPALRDHPEVVINLDGTEGYGSSFLEEAFGGLVRKEHLSAADLRRRLRIESSDQSYAREIWQYIETSFKSRQ